MIPGLEIRVVEPDDDYLGIDIAAATDRFLGSARIYAGVDQLSEFAKALEGFPSSSADRRTYEFGSRFPGFAGGFARLSFYCVDAAGHPVVTVEVDDDPGRHEEASAKLSFAFEPAVLDRFLRTLRTLERDKYGHATLLAAV